jgi:hypothetical protein
VTPFTGSIEYCVNPEIGEEGYRCTAPATSARCDSESHQLVLNSVIPPGVRVADENHEAFCVAIRGFVAATSLPMPTAEVAYTVMLLGATGNVGGRSGGMRGGGWSVFVRSPRT